MDAGLRIYDRDAEVGKEQGLSRSLVFANGLRFYCKKPVQPDHAAQAPQKGD